VTRLLPRALSPRTLTGRLRTPRGWAGAGTRTWDAPETGAWSSVSATFTPMPLYTQVAGVLKGELIWGRISGLRQISLLPAENEQFNYLQIR